MESDPTSAASTELKGGALILGIGHVPAEMSSCLFSGNFLRNCKEYTSGGALQWNLGPFSTLYNCTFYNNTIVTSNVTSDHLFAFAAALQHTSNFANATDCTFVQNRIVGPIPPYTNGMKCVDAAYI